MHQRFKLVEDTENLIAFLIEMWSIQSSAGKKSVIVNTPNGWVPIKEAVAIAIESLEKC